jgi:hypothetical protein
MKQLRLIAALGCLAVPLAVHATPPVRRTLTATVRGKGEIIFRE